MTTRLLPFQVETVDRMHEFHGRCLLAHEMGLGKTLCTLKYMKDMCRQRPAVVVCPAFLKTHWLREAKQHLGMGVTVLSGSKPRATAALLGKKIYVVNYEILYGWLDFLKSMKPRVVVGDEVQYVSSLSARRTHAFMMLCEEVPRVIGLSGTPLTNKPWELFPILHVLDPETWDNPYSFGHRYCDARKEFGHWRFDGAKNLDKLHRKLKNTCMIRYTKEQVLPDLPPKRRVVVPLEIEDRRQYERAERDLIAWLAETDVGRAQRAASDLRTRFGYLKRLAARLKLRAVIEWVQSFLHESDGKLLLGAIHRGDETPIIPRLYEEFRGVSVCVHGGHTQKQRQDAVDRFRQDKNTRILVGQEQAAGVGLNLPECSTVALAELPWTSAAVQQFVDRCHRLTSKNTVDVYMLVAYDTIEEVLCKILQRKGRVLAKVLDGEPDSDLSLPLLDELADAMLARKGV